MFDLTTRLVSVEYQAGDMPICQAILSRSFLVVPLHVVDSTAKIETLLWRGLNGSGRIISIRVELPRADLAVFTTDAAGPSFPIRFVHNPRSGMSVCIDFLHRIGSALVHQQYESTIMEVVEVEKYTYLTASGNKQSLRNTKAILLKHSVNCGLSGSTVTLSGTDQIVGFIHGNAAINGWAAICLSPHPLSNVLD
jgi:hypothetical protein